MCEPQREKSVDAKTFHGISHHSVTAQIRKRDRYLEVIRQRVTDGTYQLTAALAKLLGLPYARPPTAIDVGCPRRRPRGQQVLVEVGHNLHEDNPEAFPTEILTAFAESR